jgi:hypothetical protein
MLDNLPHDQAFSELIVSQLDTYAQKCAGWYKALVSRSQPTPSGRRVKAPAAWAESPDMEQLVSQILQSDSTNSEQFDSLVEREIALLLQAVEAEPLDPADMLEDKKTITSFCLLYTSMRWLATMTAQLRHISDRATNSARGETAKERYNQRWTLLSSSEPRATGASVYLPLNQETAAYVCPSAPPHHIFTNSPQLLRPCSIRLPISQHPRPTHPALLPPQHNPARAPLDYFTQSLPRRPHQRSRPHRPRPQRHAHRLRHRSNALHTAGHVPAPNPRPRTTHGHIPPRSLHTRYYTYELAWLRTHATQRPSPPTKLAKRGFSGVAAAFGAIL